jgi:hypothetical protein
VATRVVGYKKIKFYTLENLGYGKIELPDLQFHTTSYWITFRRNLVDRLPYHRLEVIDGVLGLGYALHSMAALHLMCDPHDLNRIAYRTNNAAFYLGDIAWKYTVRGNGCTGCPIRCHTMIKVPSAAAKYGIPEVGQNTCGGLNFGRSFFKTFPDGPRAMTSCLWNAVQW